MSLGGLSIAIGMLVDAAVVMVENIVQRLVAIYRWPGSSIAHHLPSGLRSGGARYLGYFDHYHRVSAVADTARLGRKFFVTGGAVYRVCAGSSLLLSLTVIPVLASYLLHKVAHEEPWLPRKALHVYEPILAWGLRQQRQVFIGADVYCCWWQESSAQVGKTFMPTMDEGTLIVGIEKLPSVSLEQSAALDLKSPRLS